jgi:glycosyltransferase involved in cell wall biosynthesis
VRVRPRIVHINTSFEPKGYWRDLVYLGIAKLLRLKVVYQIHGGALPAQFFGKSPLLTRLLRRVLGWPDAVVLLSAAELAAFREFAPAARLRRIANAVPIGEVDLSSARYAAQRPLAVTYLGRLAVDKGIFETIEAVRLLRERGIEVHLRIAGSGAALEQIRRAIVEAGVGERVVLVGALFGAAKEQLWRSSDVLAFPSYREGLPYALLEAMSWGAVPVVTPVGAIAEVVQDRVHGLIVPARNPTAVADALQTLSEDRALLHRLALAARERVASQFSVTRLVAEFNDLYRSLA